MARTVRTASKIFLNLSKVGMEECPESNFSIESVRIRHKRTVTFILTLFSGYLIHQF